MKKNKFVVDYNNGNLLILETDASTLEFENVLDEARKDDASPYEKLLYLLKINKLRYKIIIDTYHYHIYEM